MTVVIGVDPHKQTHTAMAVRSGTGELVGERTAAARAAGHEELLRLGRGVECGSSVGVGGRPQRQPGPGAVARCARRARDSGSAEADGRCASRRAVVREVRQHRRARDRSRGARSPGSARRIRGPEAREIKLLVDHRETLVRQRTEAQDRLRWLLHAVDPQMSIPAGALDRKIWLDRVERRLAHVAQCVEVRIARDLVARCRALTIDANELEREVALRVASYAPQLLDLKGCGPLIAGKLIPARPAGSAAFAPTRSSRASPASRRSMPPPASSSAITSTATETGS